MAIKYDYKNYMAICSEKTLQSNQKGFFMQFADHVAETAGKQWIKDVFGKLESDKDRIKIIYDHSAVKDAVINTLTHVQEIYRKKSGEVSQARRQEAEKAFHNGNKQKALVLCCQSVLRAPSNDVDKSIDSGKSLAFALWARCQVLMTLNEFSLALTDLQLALKEGLPNHLKPQAFWIMGICYKATSEENRAEVAFNLAKKLIGNDPKKLSILEEDMGKSYKDNKQLNREKPTLNNPSEEFPSASNKIAIKESPSLGRFATANQRISTGELLIVEEPYASCVLPECFGTHCHQCFARLKSPVGCPECSNVAFCCVNCRDIALKTYHSYECKYLDLLIGSGMSILSHTALRMITQNNLKYCLEVYKDRKRDRAFSLCTNEQLRTPEDFLQRTLMAAFLLRCLQKSGYFPNRSRDSVIPTEEELKIGELLLYNLQMLQFNAHEVYETRLTTNSRFRGAKAAYIGVAIYPTVALFNHDCYPSVTRYFSGRSIVINACRPISPGEMISENYGPIFTRKNLNERQASLSGRYWFTCKCMACTLDWPSLDTGLDKVSRRLRCPNNKCAYIFSLPVKNENLKCPKCKKNVCLTSNISELKHCEEMYQKAVGFLEQEKPSEGIDVICKAVDIFHRVSYPPHRETHLAQEMLRAFLADSGNVFQQPL